MESKEEIFINKIKSGQLTKIDAAEYLGISRPTLDKRIEVRNWTKGEKYLILKY